MAAIRYVRCAYLMAIGLSFFLQSIPSIGIAENVPARCWSCGNVFSMPDWTASADCPACSAVCGLSRDAGSLVLHCVDSGSKSCAFILLCPDRSTVVFTGADGAHGRRIADYLKEIGASEITVLIGAQGSVACMQSIMGIMRQFRVVRLFDPGFGGGGDTYAAYLRMLRKSDVSYHVVRAVENISFGEVKLYVMRPSSFGVDASGGKYLSLCVVHGGNSFLLSEGACGQTATFQRLPELSGTRVSRMLFQGGSTPLKAVSLLSPSDGAIVLKSDGKEIEVRSLQQISIAPSDGGHNPTAAGIWTAPSTKTSASGDKRKERININTATVPQLDELDGIGPKKAATIIEFRKIHGPFRTIDEIQKVPGIGEKLFDRNRDRMCVR